MTGPDPGLDQGLGRSGEPLHRWAVESDDDVDKAVLAEATEASGAMIRGRRLFDVIDGPADGATRWATAPGLAATPPLLLVTHSAPPQVRVGLSFMFVTG